MRVLGRLIAGLLLIVVALAATGYLLRAPLAGAAIEWAMARAGVADPSVTVDEITLNRLALSEIEGGGDLALDSFSATYAWRPLIFERRVKTLEVGPGSAVINIAGDGTVTIAGARLPASGDSDAALPFDALTVKPISFAIMAPEGEGRGEASGAFTPDAGGAFTIAAATPSLATDALRIETGALDAAVTLAADGGIVLTGTMSGDVSSAQATIRQIALAFDGEGSSWREALGGDVAALRGAGRLELRSADIITAQSPRLAFLAEEGRLERGPIREISVTGAARVAAADGRLSLSPVAEAPLRAAADRGDALEITGDGDAPLLEITYERRRAAFKAAMSGDAFTGTARLNAESESDGPWGVEASAALSEQSLAGMALGETALAASGTVSQATAVGDITVKTNIKSAEVGRFKITNGALAGLLHVDADFAAQTADVSSRGDDCLALEKVRVAITGQDSDATLAGAKLCNDAGAMLSVRWGDDPYAHVAARLSAREARYRLGETRLAGAPPNIDFSADYDPAVKLSVVEGALSGGRVVLNEAIIASNVAGRFTARLDGSALSGEVSVSKGTLAQNTDPVQVAAVAASGKARLADDKVNFEFTAATPAGMRLGVAKGAHDIRSGRGETKFASGDLEFAPNGLQPAAIMPAVKGLIGKTTGAATIDATFNWGPEPADSGSSAQFRFNDVTFAGPGVAVTQTIGLSGGLDLTQLSPLASAPDQQLTVRRVDLDALQLENGVMNFAIPGDGTIKVIDASFPWFGGTIGAYDATATFSNGEASIPLRTDKINLKEILDYVDVDGLSGEGILSGVLPIEISGGKARIENGELTSDGPGAVSYRGAATDSAAAAGDQAEIAFSILRDLRYNALRIGINGALDGRLDFKMEFEGTGDVPLNNQNVRVPVIYRINLDAALLELLNQANLSRDIELQIQRGLEDKE